MASGNYCVPGSDKVRLAGAKAAVIASAEGVREGESILASPALSSDWQRRTNVWRRLTNPARRAKRLRKRAIPQAGLIRWVQIIALCLRWRRCGRKFLRTALIEDHCHIRGFGIRDDLRGESCRNGITVLDGAARGEGGFAVH